MRVSAIIEARMGSTRLPGKVMRTIAGKPMLQILVERLGMCSTVDTVVVATPDTKGNGPIWDWCAENKVACVRGSEDDVMARVLKAAKDTGTDIIVEVTGDCPLVDPFIVDLVSAYCICDYDCAVNCAPQTWPRGVEVRTFKTSVLEDAEAKTRIGTPYWREHVSPYLYRQDSEFRWRNIQAPEIETCPDLNLSVDTEDDFRRVKDIYETLEPHGQFGVLNVLKYLSTLPTYYDIVNKPRLYKPASWLPISSQAVQALSDKR